MRVLLAEIDRPDTRAPHALMVRLLYGCGLWLMECCRVRMKDVDLDRGRLAVRTGKGGKDWALPLPKTVRGPLAGVLRWRQGLYEQELARGLSRVVIPGALEAKYPATAFSLGWQSVFASRRVSLCPQTRRPGRHHVNEWSGSAGCRARRPVAQVGQARRVPHPAALLRHPPTGGRDRPAHFAGTARAQGRADDDDLHSRAVRRDGRHRRAARSARIVASRFLTFPRVSDLSHRFRGNCPQRQNVYAPGRQQRCCTPISFVEGQFRTWVRSHTRFGVSTMRADNGVLVSLMRLVQGA